MPSLVTRRTIRIDDPLWTSVLSLAEQQETTISEIVREALTEYVAKHAQPSKGKRKRS